MPPEAIVKQLYSEKSDVWSFGCVALEIYSGGQDPWPSLPLPQGILEQLIASHTERFSKEAPALPR